MACPIGCRRPRTVPRTTGLRVAARLSVLGTRLYTVDLGRAGEIDAVLLRAIAREMRARYREAPDAEDLAATYAELAGAIRGHDYMGVGPQLGFVRADGPTQSTLPIGCGAIFVSDESSAPQTPYP